MEIKRINVEGNGGCNCCKRATLKKGMFGLEYPYTEVNQLTLGQATVRLCDDCTLQLLKELHRTLDEKE